MEQSLDMDLVETSETAFDDWGDFDAVIHQLEAQEQSESTEVATLTEPVDNSSKVEAAGDLLNAVFGLSEKAISHMSGVTFTFDERDKAEVIDASKPVLEMHGDGLLSLFGDYLPYATLIAAIIGLIYSSKCRLAELKAQGGEHGKEDSAAAETA